MCHSERIHLGEMGDGTLSCPGHDRRHPVRHLGIAVSVPGDSRTDHGPLLFEQWLRAAGQSKAPQTTSTTPRKCPF